MKNSLHNLETFTGSLARNSQKIDDVMLKVDGVMGKADNLMLGLNTLAGGKDGGELFLTVKSIRELAEDFDKRSGALMSDGRRTLGDISRAVNNLDRNPTRLLFGAAAVQARRPRRRPAAPVPPPAAREAEAVESPSDATGARGRLSGKLVRQDCDLVNRWRLGQQFACFRHQRCGDLAIEMRARGRPRRRTYRKSRTTTDLPEWQTSSQYPVQHSPAAAPI